MHFFHHPTQIKKPPLGGFFYLVTMSQKRMNPLIKFIYGKYQYSFSIAYLGFELKENKGKNTYTNPIATMTSIALPVKLILSKIKTKLANQTSDETNSDFLNPKNIALVFSPAFVSA